jgi:hypothetical protein
VGLTGTVNTNVIIGGFPLPSLTSIILGLALRPVFAGLGKVAGAVRSKIAARAARETGETAGRKATEKAAREAAEAAAPKKLLKPLKPKEMEPRFKYEDIPNHPKSWRGGRSPVVYLSDTERELYKLTIKEGPDGVRRLHKPNGEVFDTANASTFDNRPNAIYVMDTRGNLYVSLEQEAGRFHHSSLGQGKPVAGAGEIKVNDGVIQHIDRNSGHYRPREEHLDQTVAELRHQGLDVPESVIARNAHR